jgi:DNA-binding CsgD family transcriptional regulator/tetratricopeptide (TPR) repeat protein
VHDDAAISPRAVTLTLVDRTTQLEALEACFGDVALGAGCLALLAGEAGVGKTALVRAFCEQRDSRTRVLWGACDGLLTPRPLGPFVDIAADVGGGLAAAIDADAGPPGCFAALADEVADSRPTVVVIEDIQWADEATLDVLAMLARRAERVRALMLVTYRDDELGAGHPLRRVIGEIRRCAGVRSVSLPRLSAAAVSLLAEPYGVSGPQLYATTGGNSFFVTEVLEAGAGIIPETARDAVLARAEHASAGARRVLDAVAIVPQRTEVWLLEALLGDDLVHLDECIASGMVHADGPAVVFRHELARRAIEEAIPPHRRVALNRGALAALRSATADPARLAHHAEAAGDGAAVLEFAGVAGDRAAALGAHREAAAQFRRALRHADGLDVTVRASLLDQLARECGLIAETHEQIATLEAALACHQRLGDRVAQGNTMRMLSGALACKGGQEARSQRLALEAVAMLEALGPSVELAKAYSYMSSVWMDEEDMPATLAWAERDRALGEVLGDDLTRIAALNTVGTIEALNGIPSGRQKLRLSLDEARGANQEGDAARAYLNLAWALTRRREYVDAEETIAEGLDYCAERDLELYAYYLHAYRSRGELDRGRWDSAAESASLVAYARRGSPDARIPALVTIALVRARRGDPDHRTPLTDALTLTQTGGMLQRFGPIAAARAEVLWLEGRRDEIDAATADTLTLARARAARFAVGELALWRRRAGLRDDIPPREADGPYVLSLDGDATGAASAWQALGCAYEAALALSDSSDVELRRQALDELQAMDAGPAAAVVAGALRLEGVRGVPRGPRARTRENPAGLTAREIDVLGLLADGKRNAQIAERLTLSTKTVSHHVSAILRKLDAGSRGEAVAAAAQLGILAAGRA